MAKSLADTFVQVVEETEKALAEAKLADGEKHFTEDKRACLRVLKDLESLITKAKLTDLAYRPNGLEWVLDDLDAALENLRTQLKDH